MCKNVWINENLDTLQRKERAILRTVVDFAKDKGREARIVGEKIIISGTKYRYKSLNNLPEQINLEWVFTRLDKHYVYLQSEFSPHSSFAKVNFTYKRNPHTSAEQAFCFQKASGNNMPELAKSILMAGIKTTQQW